VIVRESKADGSLSAAIDTNGTCTDKTCADAAIENMQFENVKAGQLHALSDVNQELANNELNGDLGADRESWFWGLFFIGAAIAVIWNNNHKKSTRTTYAYYNYSNAGYTYKAYAYTPNCVAPCSTTVNPYYR
jgi:hypothetical protein